MTLAQSIGRRLRSARDAAQLSQMELAEKTSVDKATIHNIERGSNLPGAKTIVAICEALNCSSDHLLGIPSGWNTKTLRPLPERNLELDKLTELRRKIR